jgi:hypothetical protein
MDILYWINLNSVVVFEETRKIFFKKYLCRMRVFCPGGRAIHDEDISSSINTRVVHRNHGGSWIYRNNKSLDQSSLAQLEVFKDLLKDDTIKLRVEEPYIQVYAEDETSLKKVIEHFTAVDQSRVFSISVPRPEHIPMLQENKILRKSRRNQYRYKVLLRDGRLDTASKSSLLNYLLSMEDLVSLPAAPRKMLSSSYSSFWGVYYYTNDISINTFVELISPGIITNVHEIVTVE